MRTNSVAEGAASGLQSKVRKRPTGASKVRERPTCFRQSIYCGLRPAAVAGEVLDMNILTADELFMSVCWQTAEGCMRKRDSLQ